jgi:hypothetical protein
VEKVVREAYDFIMNKNKNPLPRRGRGQGEGAGGEGKPATTTPRSGTAAPRGPRR